MKKVLEILICGFLIIGLAGCGDTEEEQFEEENGRVIHFAYDVPYNDDSLSLALSNKEISIDDFISKLDYVASLKDGGSSIYKYNKSKKTFGGTNFYVVVCNSLDNIDDIYVAKYRENLNGMCSFKIDDLDGVSMSIKDGTLTNVGATVVITDTSNRENIYGDEYRIDKKEDGKWEMLPIIFEGNYAWNDIGYSAGEDNKLELDINWEWLYGKLESGEYRIVKDTSEAGEGTTHYITAEFVIE